MDIRCSLGGQKLHHNIMHQIISEKHEQKFNQAPIPSTLHCYSTFIVVYSCTPISSLILHTNPPFTGIFAPFFPPFLY